MLYNLKDTLSYFNSFLFFLFRTLLNYYKEFDINNKLLKVIWYYKDQTILNSCENEYDKEGKLVNQKFNSYKFSNTTNLYDKNNNLILSKNIDSDKKY